MKQFSTKWHVTRETFVLRYLAEIFVDIMKLIKMGKIRFRWLVLNTFSSRRHLAYLEGTRF
jgi:hypothetical protein